MAIPRTDSGVQAPVAPHSAAPVAPASAPRTSGRRRRPVRSGLSAYALLVPATVAIAVGLGYPLVRQFVISFQEYGLAQQFGRPAEWVGLDNYVALLSDPYVWTVIVRSFAFGLVNAALTMAIGMALAVLMAKVGKAARVTLQVGMLLAWARRCSRR